MTTRKIFRMHHEPCEGRCYCPGEVLGLQGLGLNVAEAATLLDRIVQIHEPACGREQLGYGLDVDERTGAFIASFVHFGRLEIYVGEDALQAIELLIDGALAWYATDEAKALLAEHPGEGKGACEHGDDHDLRAFAVHHSGLGAPAKAALMLSLRQGHVQG